MSAATTAQDAALEAIAQRRGGRRADGRRVRPPAAARRRRPQRDRAPDVRAARRVLRVPRGHLRDGPELGGLRPGPAPGGARRGRPGLGVRAERRGPRPGLLRDELRAARGGARPDRPVRRPQPRRRPPDDDPDGDAGRRRPRALRARHRDRGPLPAQDRLEDVLRLLDRLRRRRPEQPHVPGLPRPAGRAADDQPAGRRARPRDRHRDRCDDARQDPLGPQELLLPGPAEGLPDQPVRPAARVGRAAGLRDVRGPGHDRDHPGPPRGGHREAHPRDRRRTAAASASSTSTARARR